MKVRGVDREGGEQGEKGRQGVEMRVRVGLGYMEGRGG